MQGKIASRGAGIVFRLRVEKSTFESSLAYITLRLSLNQLRLLAVSLCIGVYSTSVLKKQLFSTCKIHLPFKAWVISRKGKQFGSSVISPVKNILCMHGCLKTATCQHTKIGGIGPREIKGRKTCQHMFEAKQMMSLCLIFRSEISAREKVEYTCIKTCNLSKRFYRFKDSKRR